MHVQLQVMLSCNVHSVLYQANSYNVQAGLSVVESALTQRRPVPPVVLPAPHAGPTKSASMACVAVLLVSCTEMAAHGLSIPATMQFCEP